jgi:hypothetical protein
MMALQNAIPLLIAAKVRRAANRFPSEAGTATTANAAETSTTWAKVE